MVGRHGAKLIGVFGLSTNPRFRTLRNLPLEALFALARRSVPETARDAVVRVINSGQSVSSQQVHMIIDQSKERPPLRPVSLSGYLVASQKTDRESESKPRILSAADLSVSTAPQSLPNPPLRAQRAPAVAGSLGRSGSGPADNTGGLGRKWPEADV